MAEGNENPTTPPASEGTAAAPAQQPASPTFTPDQLAQIESMIRTRENAAAAAARREAEGKQKPKAEPPKSPTATPSSAASTSTEDSFDQQLAAQVAVQTLAQGYADLRLTAKQQAAVTKLYKVEKPDDVNDWLTQTASDLGFTKTPNPTQAAASTATSASAAPASQQPSGPTPPAPIGSSSATASPADILSHSSDMVNAEWRTLAAKPQDLYDRANRASWRQMRQKFEQALSTVRVVVPTK